MSEADAKERLAMIRNKYSIRKGNEDPRAVELWVKGFDVSKTELTKGYLGHFVRFSMDDIGGGKATIRVEKIVEDLRIHPATGYPRRRHPNWGHPILRDVKKRKVYKSFEEAVTVLDRLEEEYPAVTRRGNRRRLGIMVYEKHAGSKKKVSKITLRISEAEGLVRIVESKRIDTNLVPRTSELYFSKQAVYELALNLEMLLEGS